MNCAQTEAYTFPWILLWFSLLTYIFLFSTFKMFEFSLEWKYLRMVAINQSIVVLFVPFWFFILFSFLTIPEQGNP